MLLIMLLRYTFYCQGPAVKGVLHNFIEFDQDGFQDFELLKPVG